MTEPEGTNQNRGDGASPPPPQASGQPQQEHATWTSESSPPPEKKKSHLWLWILLGVFLALIIAGLVVIGVYRNNTTDVPDLRGLTVSEGVRALKDVGLELGDVEYSSEVPAGVEEGQIIEQEPVAGKQVDKGSTVSVVVAGKVEVEVPDVIGQQVEEATEALETAGFKVKSADVEAEADPGTVVDQSPAAGEMAAPGSEVTILVAAAAADTLVPKVVGLNQDEATQTLQDAGYEVQSKGTHDDKVQEGIVIAQSPDAGTIAQPGTRVDIVVSLGKNPQVTVPDVVGRTEADAANALVGTGLEVVTSPTYSAEVPVGQVLSQDPTGGTTVNRGSTVSITVSQGPQPPETATVPGVMGKTEAEAVDALQQAGYQAAILNVYSAIVPEGIVALQLPTGGSITEPGITVGIVVSLGARPPEFVIVPDVKGMTVEEATAALEELGLVAETVEVFTSLAPEGELFAQLPPPDASVPPGSTVVLIVSAGPYPVVEPLEGS